MLPACAPVGPAARLGRLSQCRFNPGEFPARSTALPQVGWQDDAMKILIKLIVTAVALWVATLLIPGIHLHTHSTTGKIGTLVVVALIFGIINAILKPIVKTIGCLAYAITLGLISIIVNGLLFWLVSYIA